MTKDFLSELTPERHPTIDFIKGMCDTEVTPAYSKAVQRRREDLLEIRKLFVETLSESQKKIYDKLDEFTNELSYDEENERFIAGYKLATRLIIEGIK